MGIVYANGFQTYNNNAANFIAEGWTIDQGGPTLSNNQLELSSSNNENLLYLMGCNAAITTMPLSIGYKVVSKTGTSSDYNWTFGIGDVYNNHVSFTSRVGSLQLVYNSGILASNSVAGDIGLCEVILTGSEMIAYRDGIEVIRASYSEALNCDTTRCFFYTHEAGAIFDLVYVAEGLDSPFGTLNKALITPSADSSVQCTPSTGTDNYACVNTHDDSTYNSGTDGQIDKFTGNSPTLTGNSIVAVSSRYRGKMSGGSSGGIVPIVSNTELGQITLTGSFAEYSVVNTTNPATGNPWTASELNSLVFGYKSVVS